MKKRLILLGTVLTMLTGGAEPVKALLVVQNHTGAECLIKLPNLATRLSVAVRGATSEAIDPHDVVGETPNRGATGRTSGRGGLDYGVHR